MACAVGFIRADIPPLRPVAASSALTPNFVNVAIDAPTSSKVIPNVAAKGVTRPKTGASVSASNLPSLTVFNKISDACAAVRLVSA